MSTDSTPRLERLPSVLGRTGLGRSTLYASIAAGTFPAPVKLSTRAIGFVGSEIDLWIEARIASRGAARQPSSQPTDAAWAPGATPSRAEVAAPSPAKGPGLSPTLSPFDARPSPDDAVKRQVSIRKIARRSPSTSGG